MLIYMATVVRFKNIKIKVNANDHNPPHCHVEGYGASVRINLLTFEQMNDTDFSPAALREIIEQVKKYHKELLAEWESHHGKDEV